MWGCEPYWHIGFLKENHSNGMYIPKRSQKLKNKKLRTQNKKRGKK